MSDEGERERMTPAEVARLLERLEVLEEAVCAWAWSRFEACPVCEARDEHADCLCEALGRAREGAELELLRLARAHWSSGTVRSDTAQSGKRRSGTRRSGKRR